MYLGEFDLRMVYAGFILMIVGIVLVIIGLVAGSMRGDRVEGGAIIIIGPIPIVLGSSPGVAKALVIAGIFLTAMAIIAYILLSRGNV